MREFIAYAVFGVLTTVINIISYWISAHILGLAVMPSTVIAWILAVLFAYFTNRKWVFQSSAHTKAEILKELVSFFACRISTGIADIIIMYVFADVLKFNDVIIKTISNIIVIALNYLGSKLIIFRKRKD